ncbi:Protein tanc2 [Branchiostoma belcheri]|nr:Protein tanc2 [Branchiostoma belcheri]
MSTPEGAPKDCPICGHPYNKGKKRRLIDACGHERCFTCMFQVEECPICNKPVPNGHTLPVSDSVTTSTKEQVKEKQTDTVAVHQHTLVELNLPHPSVKYWILPCQLTSKTNYFSLAGHPLSPGQNMPASIKL